VKSIKHHLKRCIGIYTLTFEEMSTCLCRIEACLNSRPIAPASDNLDDYNMLTPVFSFFNGDTSGHLSSLLVAELSSRLKRM